MPPRPGARRSSTPRTAAERAPRAGLDRFRESRLTRLELPYGPYLTPRWDSSGGAIEGDTSRGVATWRAPDQPGVFDVTLVVSDGVVFVGQQLSLRVTEGGSQAEPVPPANDSAPAATEEAAPPATNESPVGPTESPTAELALEPTAEAPAQETESPAEATPEGDGPPGPAGN